jgi:hypothetical protein
MTRPADIHKGIGSADQQTANHWAALRKAEREGREAPGTTDRLIAEAKARKAASQQSNKPKGK